MLELDLTFRLKLKIAYDGTDFCGWQKQNSSTYGKAVSSVQEQLESAISKLFHQPIQCNSSGRTDAGVHALAQIVHCDVPRDPRGIKFAWALKSSLPTSIAVKKVWLAPDDFHSLFSCEAKTYRYVVHTGPTPPVFLNRYCLWYPHKFDLERLNRISKLIEGTHDFKCFQSRGTELASTVRTVFKAKWTQKSKYLYHFEITGDGFLKQMVRNIVGTQFLFCKDSIEPGEIINLIKMQDRTLAGWTAAPQGLFLKKVYYSQELDKRCLQI